MRLEQIMKRDVHCLSPDDTVRTAAQKMRDHGVGFLPVCDAGWTVLGTVTDRDLAVRALAAGIDPGCPVRDVMTREVIACSPQATLDEAEKLMAEHKKSRLLCTDDAGRLAGVVSLSDIAQCEKDAPAAETMRRITARESDSARRAQPR
jgi:CBS domain-containing protein